MRTVFNNPKLSINTQRQMHSCNNFETSPAPEPTKEASSAVTFQNARSLNEMGASFYGWQPFMRKDGMHCAASNVTSPTPTFHSLASSLGSSVNITPPSTGAFDGGRLAKNGSTKVSF